MNNKKLLSITVPCYNSQDYMENCINSLVSERDRIEIIIINDGSSDRTGEIADMYAEKYPDCVRVVHQENGGHGEGINQGVKHATGTYFKVVDSDDTLSSDFSAFLDALEECEKAGGIDLAVTNYYYVHTDGVGDRSIDYSTTLPTNKIFTWDQTKAFKLHQMLTIHSCTFRTELMKSWHEPLPRKVFYEDNLMVCKTVSKVKKMYYFPADLYRYGIGRPDRSVQESTMMKRYTHQLLVTKKCFESFHFDDVNEPMLKKYLKHEMFIMFGIAIMFTRLNNTKETDADLEAMWSECIKHDKKWGKHFRYFTPLSIICIRGKSGRFLSKFFYRIANKIVRFN
jgi:glycosyltransferase involved in cell wall biosynthesis